MGSTAQIDNYWTTGVTMNPNGSANPVKQTVYVPTIEEQDENWARYQVKNKIDDSYKEIEDNKKKAAADLAKKQEAHYNEVVNAQKKAREELVNKPHLTEEEVQKLKAIDESVRADFSKFSPEEKARYNDSLMGTVDIPKQTATAPTTPNGGGSYTPPSGQQANGGSNGGGVATPPPKNLANQYTFANGHKEFDKSGIPNVLQGGKITPARYFAQNNLNWFRDSKRIANEMGMSSYRGTPGENYALVQYLEDKKNGVVPGQEENGEPVSNGRKFDGVKIGDNIPNRFTEADRQQLLTMTPEEQNKFIQQRNLQDLQKMLPGNVALINKVFGTNYTSDDLTGGVGRATIMGTGMTQAGMEVQKLIAGLKPGQAAKFMNKGGELDNVQADNIVIAGGDKTEQSGRRKILEGIVDGTMDGSGTSLDAKDQAYMQQYKQFKAEKLVADDYNAKIQEWNSIDAKKDPMRKNLLLKQIQNDVNHTMKTNPEVYASLKAELDRIPEFAKSGKIPTITQKASPVAPGETRNNSTGNPKTNNDAFLTKPSNNNVPGINPAPGATPNPDTSGSGTPTVAAPVDQGGQPIPVAKDQPSLGNKNSGGGYSSRDYEPNIGYSSNSISRG